MDLVMGFFNLSTYHNRLKTTCGKFVIFCTFEGVHCDKKNGDHQLKIDKLHYNAIISGS